MQGLPILTRHTATLLKSRRRFVRHLGTLGAVYCFPGWTRSAEVKPAHGVFRAVELNHLSLEFEMAHRAEEFYRQVLGMTSVSHGRGGTEKFMHFQQGFVNVLATNRNTMNHFCMSIEDFDGQAAFQLLSLAQTEPFRMGQRNLHCYDPDRLNVQVQEERHGWGRISSDTLTDADRGIFKTVRIHHISLNVTNLELSQGFYQEIFGLTGVSGNPDTTRRLLTVGPNAYLELHQADTPGMNHCCFAVESFDASNLPEALMTWADGKISQPEPGVVRIQDPGGHIVEITSPDHKMS
ncbi:MAG: VOC family protein [Pirellulaceae bacterium]|nr:VOC family protein [Pirellulaceae bacterium]